MLRSIEFFYGMSGALKGTTIKTKSGYVVWSDIKPWKNWRDKYFPDSPTTHSNFTLLHLMSIKNIPTNLLERDTPIIIERGVTDSLFYYSRQKEPLDNTIQDLVDLEQSLLPPGNIKKTLLVMCDQEFIESKVLTTEITRRQEFPTLTDYITSQEKYVEFTTKWNRIDEIVYIKDAYDYIKKLKEK